jgi:hypothetical protein
LAKIIVAAPPVPGEFIPLLQIARGLAARGHQITVLTGSGFRAAVEQAGLSFAPLTGAADFDVRELHSQPGRAALPPPAQVAWDLVNIFISPMPDEHAALQELLSRDPGQYLIANTLFLGAWPARLGAPGPRPARWVGVSAVPLALSSEDTTFFGPVPVGPGEDPKAANRTANAQFQAAIRPADDRAGELLAELGAGRPASPFLDAMYTLPDETAVLSVPGFEFERSDLPGNVHLAGILPPPAGRGLGTAGLVGRTGRFPPGRGRDAGHGRQRRPLPAGRARPRRARGHGRHRGGRPRPRPRAAERAGPG